VQPICIRRSYRELRDNPLKFLAVSSISEELLEVEIVTYREEEFLPSWSMRSKNGK